MKECIYLFIFVSRFVHQQPIKTAVSSYTDFVSLPFSHYTLHATSLKMLDFFSIFSKGGIVLWYFQGTSQLFTPPINALIKSVILQVSLSHVYLMRQPHLTYGEITSSSCPVITNKLVFRKLSSVLVKLFLAHYEISFIWNSNDHWTFDFDKLDHHQNSFLRLDSVFFFSTLGLGPGPLELGKLATKLEFWEISHFNKPFRLKVCLRYLNNCNNKWMPVLSIGEIKYMITLYKK